jgi:hypothetical protein
LSERNNRGGASGLLRDQKDIFGVHEQRILHDAYVLLAATPVKKAPSLQGQRSSFGIPAWYERRCEQISRAVWRKQLSEREATALLAHEHGLMLAEMERDKRWRRPRGRTGALPPWLRRRAVARWRGWTCADCGGPVGVFTGICAPCHFKGWWW